LKVMQLDIDGPLEAVSELGKLAHRECKGEFEVELPKWNCRSEIAEVKLPK